MILATLYEFVSTTQSLIDAAELEGLRLRLLGSMAFRFHCPKYVGYLDAMKRELTDIDFVTSSQDRTRLRRFFSKLGYTEDRDILVATEGARYCYRNPMNDLGIDVFFDRLDYCHSVELGDRLHLDSPTISLADLVLEKSQIVEIDEKDIKDLIVLFLEHDLGEDDRESIDHDYISRVLGNDWGFHFTSTTNLNKVAGFLDRYETLSDDNRATVRGKISRLLQRIDSEPKSLKWRMRAKLGTKVRWYNEVSDKEATF
jgi:hypothetical protein